MGRYSYYWVAAASMYVFSFLAGFSIGLYTLSLAFALLAVALAYSTGLAKRPWHAAAAGAAGFAVWAACVFYLNVDDYWLFFPVYWLFKPLFG